MKTTIESTFQYQAALEWSVPSRWAPQLFADLDRLQAYDAAATTVQTPFEKLHESMREGLSSDTAKVAAMKARALHAGADKIMYLEAAVEYLLRAHRPQLVSWTGSRHSRAEWAKKQLQAAIGYAPGWRTIDTYLDTLHI